MNNPSVLIVDDEKNIRLTMALALETMQISVDTAASGEEALEKLLAKNYHLMLLDLRLPGLGGIEVLQRVTDKYPEMMVIIITAFGSIESAVQAMQIGAVDFLQKPFDPQVVMNLVKRVLKEPPAGRPARKYEYYLEAAKQSINLGEFEAAIIYAKKAIFINYNRPEAYNILGAICEVKANRQEADKNYRIALEIDPTYEPARKNFERLTNRPYSQIGIIWDNPPIKKRSLLSKIFS